MTHVVAVDFEMVVRTPFDSANTFAAILSEIIEITINPPSILFIAFFVLIFMAIRNYYDECVLIVFTKLVEFKS